MEYSIFHAINPTFTAPAAAVIDAELLVQFKPVAFIPNAASLEAAYALTQNINAPWVEAPGVRPIVTGPTRSTSVGDIIIESGPDQPALAWMVGSVGFTPLTPGPVAPHVHEVYRQNV